MNITRPMLAATIDDVSKLRFPLLATPKIDGIRCLVIRGDALSRTFKLIPNKYIREQLSAIDNDLDGELIVGDNFQECSSGIMSRDGCPDFKYCVFDFLNITGASYKLRMSHLEDIELPSFCEKILPTMLLDDTDLTEFEESCINQGYEGVMLRSPDSPYKNGRSTFNEHYLLKLKRFKDSEAIVIGFEERMHNANKASSDNFGLIERSSHKDNMIPMNTLGALVVRDIVTGIEFNIGTGFDDRMRVKIWDNMNEYLGQLVTYKYQPHGVKDKPRCPVFKCFRKD